MAGVGSHAQSHALRRTPTTNADCEVQVPKSKASPVTEVSHEKRTKKEDKKVTIESADRISDYLRLWYMRNRNDEQTINFLYGKAQGMSKLLPYRTMARENQLTTPCRCQSKV